ncbi:hypothetical protein MF271_20690 (plasmid) [Deinococcus sp. KNUC1210]|uniref:hypothetical protein n=1 Tax=Deinococcus sp. KNUC1210 TaxID=2917691 RepID=UPI001EF0D090|nr:hypothetical protein [Deinococcus sp. KNUC1210]ULH17477.1 hypothetical protein MF271_20690 [Deinococcus sp. KNUC1210]
MSELLQGVADIGAKKDTVLIQAVLLDDLESLKGHFQRHRVVAQMCVCQPEIAESDAVSPFELMLIAHSQRFPKPRDGGYRTSLLRLDRVGAAASVLRCPRLQAPAPASLSSRLAPEDTHTGGTTLT